MARNIILSIGVIAAILLCPGNSFAQERGLNGRWRGDGGEIRVTRCVSSSELCVVVSAGDSGRNSMARLIGKTVVKDLVRIGPGRWRGTYIADGKDLAATVTLMQPDVAQMRVCLFSWFPYLLCEMPTYRRVR